MSSMRNFYLYKLGQMKGIPIDMLKGEQTKEEQAEMVDAWLNHLQQREPKVARVLKCHYTEVGTIRSKADKLRLPKSSYYDALQNGLRWLGYQLTYNKASLYELCLMRRPARISQYPKG